MSIFKNKLNQKATLTKAKFLSIAKDYKEYETVISRLEKKQEICLGHHQSSGDLFYKPFNEMTNIFILGQTKSGKTTSALSLVFSLKKTFDDSLFFFADGKRSPDWDLMVIKKEEVAKDKSSFENLINKCYYLYLKRENDQNLLKNLSPIFITIDEPWPFLMDIDFDKKQNIIATLAFKLKTMLVKGSAVNFHFIFISQRDSEDDFPSSIRENFSMQLIHNLYFDYAVQKYLLHASSLKEGEFILMLNGKDEGIFTFPYFCQKAKNRDFIFSRLYQVNAFYLETKDKMQTELTPGLRLHREDGPALILYNQKGKKLYEKWAIEGKDLEEKIF